MKLQNNWRQKSLEILENQSWGDPETAPTGLVKRCIELSKIPVGDFSPGDLRVMIGQQFGLPFLIPLALEKLRDNIFIEADYYEGDLLSNVLDIDTSFWNDNENYWIQLNDLIKNKREELKNLRIMINKFDNAQCSKKHSK